MTRFPSRRAMFEGGGCCQQTGGKGEGVWKAHIVHPAVGDEGRGHRQFPPGSPCKTVLNLVAHRNAAYMAETQHRHTQITKNVAMQKLFYSCYIQPKQSVALNYKKIIHWKKNSKSLCRFHYFFGRFAAVFVIL